MSPVICGSFFVRSNDKTFTSILSSLFILDPDHCSYGSCSGRTIETLNKLCTKQLT